LDHLRARLLNNDHLFVLNRLGLYLHLFVRLQALILGFLAHALDCRHHIRLLRQESIPQVGCPLKVVG
jgi:hypothetical protein